MEMVRAYLIIGTAGFILFGAISMWADNRKCLRLDTAMSILAILCFPAIVGDGIVIVAGSILQ